MQRRNFLKSALLTAGAFSMPLVRSSLFAVNTSNQQQKVFKKSIMWGTLGMEGSVLDKCKAVKATGYQGIEPNSHMDRNEILAAINATGLIVSDVCCSSHWDKPLSHPDASVRQDGMEGAIIALEDAKAYGTDAILLVPGAVNETVSYDECWNRSTECIKKILLMAEKLKVKICIENVWNNFLLSPLEACRYIDQFNSPYVRFYFDCGNILMYGWPEQWIRILAHRIGRIHIKEFSKDMADKNGRWAGFNVKLTEGNVNWTNVMREIHTHYTSDWLTTEQDNNKTKEELQDLSKRFDKILLM